MMIEKPGNKRFACYLSPLITFAILFTLFWTRHYAPFGNNSLAWADADIQYLDFFAYLKDVLEGRQKIDYTLNYGLGGTYWGIFSYYLNSPFNILVFFFRKEQFHTLFNLLVALKLAMAGFTMSYYLSRRFSLNNVTCLLLSLGYSLSQYSIAQCSNIMWLDGVYMLPLVLLGVYNAVTHGKITFLSVAVALSIIFNWYTAGINCLFSGFYFLLEYYLLYSVPGWKLFLSKVIVYVTGMLVGILLSCFIFVPTIAALSSGAGSRVSLRTINFNLNGNPLSMIHSYTLGAVSSPHNVALFCGSFVLIGCLRCFRNNMLKRSVKKAFVILLLGLVLVFYWQPFFILFSLLVSADSYWFRYSYVGIFTLVFMASFVYKSDEENPLNEKDFMCCFVYSILLLMLDYAKPSVNSRYLYRSLVYLFGQLLCLYLICNVQKKYQKVFMCFLLCSVVAMELGDNARLLMRIYNNKSVSTYEKYVSAQQNQIAQLLTHDDGLYRVSQNTPRRSTPYSIVANYNESVAFNYPSISSYTSCPDSRQNIFLERLGYRTEAVNITIVNTSLLAADAILGVKYYLSAYPINGLEKVDFNLDANKKSIYLNKFALPMFFTYIPNANQEDSLTQASNKNPFIYQNKAFSLLLGSNADLYSSVKFSRKIQGRLVEYILDLPEGNVTLYGNITWNRNMEAEVKVGEQLITPYSCWLSPSVFYIPTTKGDKTVTVSLLARNALAIKEEQFYALDLNKLEQASKMISAHEVKDVIFTGTSLRCAVQGKVGESLFISIPYHKGWHIRQNGESITPKRFGDCMMTIPLKDGKNIIEMHFTVPSLATGCILSGLGGAALLVLYIFQKHGHRFLTC